jgi:hypothetical protein
MFVNLCKAGHMRIALGAAAALILLAACGDPNATTLDRPDDLKVFVCKYVGKPGVDERLQTGQNPISVSINAIPQHPVDIGSYFADAQGRSYVLAWDTGQPEPSASSCPGSPPPPPPPPPSSTTSTTTTSELVTTTTCPDCVINTVTATTTPSPTTTTTAPPNVTTTVTTTAPNVTVPNVTVPGVTVPNVTVPGITGPANVPSVPPLPILVPTLPVPPITLPTTS